MRVILILLVGALLQACAPSQRIEIVPRVTEVHPVQQNTIHQHSIRLANTMAESLRSVAPGAKVAVGTFLPPKTLQPDSVPWQQQDIALQLQESFITIYSQMGFAVVEYRTRDHIALQNHADVMLSRNIDVLANRQEIDFYVTGTLSEQEDAYVVNVRMIDSRNNQVVAAATDYLPNTILTRADKVRLNNGQLQRRAY
ncbi:FlgO family outer membrane protein [Pseudoalteromonas sp. SSDWG2]|uniref:FlgO family outer membrane protein n=1 Tax=Pseudoalteromonas sp. SSDWG2 TaxID=3139391 RepID=UPI003BACC542